MEFKYGDVVEVVGGFYEGQKGIVATHRPIHSLLLNRFSHYEYGIHLEDDYIVISEQDLRLIKREKGKTYGIN